MFGGEPFEEGAKSPPGGAASPVQRGSDAGGDELAAKMLSA